MLGTSWKDMVRSIALNRERKTRDQAIVSVTTPGLPMTHTAQKDAVVLLRFWRTYNELGGGVSQLHSCVQSSPMITIAFLLDGPSLGFDNSVLGNGYG